MFLVICFPVLMALNEPIFISIFGASAFIKLDFPTPEGPETTMILPFSIVLLLR